MRLVRDARVHEALRVYHDRLVDDDDREWISDEIREQVRALSFVLSLFVCGFLCVSRFLVHGPLCLCWFARGFTGVVHGCGPTPRLPEGPQKARAQWGAALIHRGAACVAPPPFFQNLKHKGVLGVAACVAWRALIATPRLVLSANCQSGNSPIQQVERHFGSKFDQASARQRLPTRIIRLASFVGTPCQRDLCKRSKPR